MKKWMYLIFPGAMLGIFLVFFLSHSKEAEARESARLENVRKKQAEDDAKKKADEARARADAEKAAAARAKEDADKEAKKLAILAENDRQVREATEKALADGAASQKQIDASEAELERLHRQKDQLTRDVFEAAKQVELAKVAKRTAELEIQRTVELVARKAQDSYITRLPPPPPPPPKS
jgi:hypothetical protein